MLSLAPMSAGSALTMQRARRVAFRPAAVLRSILPIKTVPKVSKPAPVVKTGTRGPALPFDLGFTKTNELFVGRMAMLGFAASLVGEILTGKGALAQLGYETNVPTFDVDWFIVFLIGFNLVAAIIPTSQTFKDEEQESLKERPAGALQDPRISMLDPAFWGITGKFGFSKENELFVGRMAQLGFAASLIGEVAGGKGPLAQFGFETGIPLQDSEFGLLVFISFFLFAAINEGSGRFVDEKVDV